MAMILPPLLQYEYYLKHKGGYGGALNVHKKHNCGTRFVLMGQTLNKCMTKLVWYHFFITWRHDKDYQVRGKQGDRQTDKEE